ncbi:hypothetical protein GCM10017044_25690 [Kordiimonas sediminis]|uniref:Uncharacterized protein n=2 Tax=Kordiimonas sediminis TaxID=1735581 RepID=A0A919AW34_9PROT|nr:hypothetical protein GCM10017044_25690 [Kordiimonas sediminis]
MNALSDKNTMGGLFGHMAPVGIGLKAQHYHDVLNSLPPLSFFEVHAENHMVFGGPHRSFLEKITSQYALSIHGVGLSLGSAEGIDRNHLHRFKALVDDYNPALVSEHLAWSVSDGTYLNDLLPLPLNEESLRIVSDNVACVQDAISRPLLVENPSSYLAFEGTTIPEPEFLIRLAENTGCRLLLDVNNVYVSACNMSGEQEAKSAETGYAKALDYISQIPADLIGEIHLAGHLLKDVDGTEIRIDDHGSHVDRAVWSLYAALIRQVGARPTLIEWDTNIPPLSTLVSEAQKAQTLMQNTSERPVVDSQAHGQAVFQ